MQNAAIFVARAITVVLILGMSLVVGDELRSVREQASDVAARPSLTPSPIATAGRPTASLSTPAAPCVDPVKCATMVPAPSGPSATPYVKPTIAPVPTLTYPPTSATLSGHVTAGTKPVAGADIRVYPANSFQNGPTPVPPEAALARTDAAGAYHVTLPSGSYKVGAFIDETAPVVAKDGFHWVTWYGNAFAIGTSTPITITADRSGIDIALLRTYAISGRVLGRDGLGVPNVAIAPMMTINGIGFPFIGAVTDGNGSFRLRSPATSITIVAELSGVSGSTGASVDVDVHADVTGLSIVVDRGYVVRGVLRDASGAPIANADFGVGAAALQPCAYSCNARTDATGAFAVTTPSGALRFFLWPKLPTDPQYVSAIYDVTKDATIDPVLVKR